MSPSSFAMRFHHIRPRIRGLIAKYAALRRTSPRRLMTIKLLVLYLATAAPDVFAQSAPQSGYPLTTSHGLPHNEITGVEQDRAGFIWIATYDGLARYDGRSVKVFRNRPGDSLSLADNSITELLPAADGTFIVNTESGTVQRFAPDSERFTTLVDRQFLDRNQALINQVQLSADGNHLWGLLANVRLIDYDIPRKTLRTFSVPDLVGDGNGLHDFILTPTGHIYGHTPAGLFQFDTRTGRKRIIPFPFAKPPGNYWPIDYHRVILGPDGEIAVFGYDRIALFNPAQNRFRTVSIPEATHQADTWYKLATLSDNRLYLGYGDRLYRLDAHDRLTPVPLPGPATRQTAPWLLDRSRVLWVGGRLAGVSRVPIDGTPFDFFPKRKSFSQDLLQEDLGVALPAHYVVWDIDHWPRYVLGPDHTGYLIDPEHVYRHLPGRPALTELTALRKIDGQGCCKLCLKVSRDGQVWLYSNYWGLLASGPDGRTDVRSPKSQLPLMDKTAGHDAGDIQPLGQSVWVGSQYGLGLFRYDIRRQRYDAPLPNDQSRSNGSAVPPQSNDSFPSIGINCLSADPIDSTVLWIGTAGGGLWRLDTRTMKFRRLGEPEGFPNGTIVSLETDSEGMLWCATNRGLVRVNAKTLTWRHFTTDDGLAENSFLQTSSAHLPDGRLVFGTPNGRIVFDPRAIRDERYEPPLVLTSLLINNRPAEANRPDSPLPRPLNTLSELVLNPTQNFLTIGFAGLDYGNAEKLSYRYWLIGVDKDWVTVGTQNTANYTQLAPGRYVFRVNSTTADGRWSRQVKQLAIVIRPPFWATWWAYLCYALAFGGLVLGFIRFQVGQGRQQHEIDLKRREAERLRALDEVKTRFFSNITHEFRTPLTLILSPTEKLLTEPKHDTPTRTILASVHNNVRQLLGLINQLLDLSKLEGGNMGVSLVRGDALAYVRQLVESVEPMAAARGIEMHLTIEHATDKHADGPWLFDADKWSMIITNLLSNALKFTPAGGQVTVTFEPMPVNGTSTSTLVLQVADTGIGIAPQYMDHIFDRFYQVDDTRTRTYEGTGIGLALVKELTELLGGTIRVQSRTEPPTGTMFTLTLPLLPANGADVPELSAYSGPFDPYLPEPNPATERSHPPGPTVTVHGEAPLILVIDDNQELRSFLAAELAQLYRVRTAADGREGWDICRDELPDVIVSDVMMPHLDGYQLTQHIKTTPSTNHIAVVLLTAKAAHQSRITGLEQGADDYLTKPFHLGELHLRLANLLTRQANLRTHLKRQLSAPAPPAGEPVTDPFVGRLHQLIESRLGDPSLGVEDLAEAMAMSRRTLHRKLTATTDLSAHDFIRHYRLQRATHLLRAGRSVSETAYTVGFESPAYFTKVFKQTYRQTPSEFSGR